MHHSVNSHQLARRSLFSLLLLQLLAVFSVPSASTKYLFSPIGIVCERWCSHTSVMHIYFSSPSQLLQCRENDESTVQHYCSVRTVSQFAVKCFSRIILHCHSIVSSHITCNKNSDAFLTQRCTARRDGGPFTRSRGGLETWSNNCETQHAKVSH